jgi:hypothetical protein
VDDYNDDAPLLSRYSSSDTESAPEHDPKGSTTALYPASEVSPATPSPPRLRASRKISGKLSARSSFINTRESIRKLAAPFRRYKNKSKKKSKFKDAASSFVPRNKLEQVLGEHLPGGYENQQPRYV